MGIDRPWLVAGALAALAALWVAMLLLGTGDVDRTVLMALYAGDEPWLALGAIGLSYLGTWPTVVVVTVLGAVFLYYGLKAVQLTEMANRVWKRTAEYSLILTERQRLAREARPDN
jgi:hypothetical protein